jgi:hypothetical protein
MASGATHTAAGRGVARDHAVSCRGLRPTCRACDIFLFMNPMLLLTHVFFCPRPCTTLRCSCCITHLLSPLVLLLPPLLLTPHPQLEGAAAHSQVLDHCYCYCCCCRQTPLLLLHQLRPLLLPLLPLSC